MAKAKKKTKKVMQTKNASKKTKTAKKAKTAKVAKPVKKAAAKKNAVKKVVKKTVQVKKTKALNKPEVKKSAKLDFTKLVSPLDDRLIVQISEPVKMTAGGLYIPDTAEVSGNRKGLVVAIGRGRRDKFGKVHPMGLSVGEEVLFEGYAGTKIQIMGQDLTILRESEVLGVLE